MQRDRLIIQKDIFVLVIHLVQQCIGLLPPHLLVISLLLMVISCILIADVTVALIGMVEMI